MIDGIESADEPSAIPLELISVPIRLMQVGPYGPCFVGCRPHPPGAMLQTPSFIVGFGADGPKKRGCGVQPCSATFLRPPKRASAFRNRKLLRVANPPRFGRRWAQR